jgi:hypothetical protein
MVQFILVILGISYVLRRPKIKLLSATQFPGLPPDTFKKWQALTLRSIDIFVWAAWGLAAFGFLFGPGLVRLIGARRNSPM